MKRSTKAILAGLAAIVLAACNNSNNNNNPGGGSGCGNPPNQMEVVNPRPGGRNVNPNVSGVYVAFSSALSGGNSFNLCIVSSVPISTPCTSNFGQVSASQVPPGSRTPTYPNPVYYFTAFGTPVGPLNSIQLFWNDGGSGCTPNVVVGTFTTGA